MWKLGLSSDDWPVGPDLRVAVALSGGDRDTNDYQERDRPQTADAHRMAPVRDLRGLVRLQYRGRLSTAVGWPPPHQPKYNSYVDECS